MKTPVCDFVREYASKNPVRLHMPGHKGEGDGADAFDITEIDGADTLFVNSGILGESQKNASALFGTAKTLYSAEGSSLAIRAMLWLVSAKAKRDGTCPLVLAGRNAHKVFTGTAALLGIDVKWIFPDGGGYLECSVTASGLGEELENCPKKPCAVYITSPDYLGNIADIEALSAVCGEYGVPLLVDNAHGAYLRFLKDDIHPITLGADMCCDSAHKTLPVLTGGAYLHISKTAEEFFAENAENAMSLFASTSPSYLILQSLDSVNPLLESGFSSLLEETVRRTGNLKKYLCSLGFELAGDEPIKVTVKPKSFGYTGCELAGLMQKENIYPEFSDPDFLVMMFSTCTKQKDFDRVTEFFGTLQRKEKITAQPPAIGKPAVFMNAHAAVTAPCEKVRIEKSVGRVLAQPGVSCPPAVPLVTCGEVISEEAVRAFRYYGIEYVYVVK